MDERLLTTRLIGWRFGQEHFTLLRRLHTDRQVMRTLSVDGCPLSAAQSRAMLERVTAHWTEHGYGLWAFFERRDAAPADDEAFVGYCGLLTTQDGPGGVELAYAVRSSRWREGLASEMAGAALDVAFRRLGLDSVVAFALPTNYGSRRVMEKVGLEYEQDVIHAGLPHLLYRRFGAPLAVTLTAAADDERPRRAYN